MIRSAAALGVGLIVVGVLLLIKFWGVRLTLQSSDSMPKGLYEVTVASLKEKQLTRGETVVFLPPVKILPFLQTRHWVSSHDWMMKKIMGIPGDKVCLKNHLVWINKYPLGPILDEDHQHRVLPHLKFCRTLSQDEYFVMSTYIERSFDSRYFGPISGDSIIGKALPLWIS